MRRDHAARLAWLTARPIAHRGLHDAARGIIENTPAAVRAAIAGNYGIEVDLQISADGEAMVHHDDALGRLTEGAGALDRFTAAALKRVPFRATADRMMTLGELCDLVGGRAPADRTQKPVRRRPSARRARRRSAVPLSRPGRRDVVRSRRRSRGSAASRRSWCAGSWPPNTGRIRIGI